MGSFSVPAHEETGHSGHDVPPPPGRQPDPSERQLRGGGWRHLAAAIVLAVGISTALYAANEARQATEVSLAPPVLAGATAFNDQFNCLEAQLRRKLPMDGVAVFVSADWTSWGKLLNQLGMGQAAVDLWHHRLIEMATPWYVIAPTRAQAQFFLTLTRGSGADNCGGLAIDLQRP